MALMSSGRTGSVTLCDPTRRVAAPSERRCGPRTVRERAQIGLVLEQVVVVGASLAGLRAAETLRGAGYRGLLTLVGAERHLPYDRPPLTKKLLAGEWE